MAEKENASQSTYRQARSAFDALALDEKAMFLVEAAATTLGRSLEEAGQALAQFLEHLFETAAETCAEEEAAEPEATSASA